MTMNNERRNVAEVYNRDDMLAFYDVVATRYGLWSGELRLLQRYCQMSERLLVIGCGTGREVLSLQEHGFAPLVGIDIAQRTLQKARAKCRRRNLTAIWLQQADVVHLPYRDASFDHAIMLAQVIQNIPKRACRQQALREIRRVLRRDGCCLLSSFNHPISVLYMLLLGRQAKAVLNTQTSTASSKTPDSQATHHRIPSRTINRIAWELHPTIHSYDSPLPITWRLGFWLWRNLVNPFRTVMQAVSPEPGRWLEPNDVMIDHRNFRFRLMPQEGDLFAHFPDADEVIEDLSRAGFQLVEYRSLEELQQERNFSDTLRRSKRLLFYVAQKRC